MIEKYGGGSVTVRSHGRALARPSAHSTLPVLSVSPARPPAILIPPSVSYCMRTPGKQIDCSPITAMIELDGDSASPVWVD